MIGVTQLFLVAFFYLLFYNLIINVHTYICRSSIQTSAGESRNQINLVTLPVMSEHILLIRRAPSVRDLFRRENEIGHTYSRGGDSKPRSFPTSYLHPGCSRLDSVLRLIPFPKHTRRLLAGAIYRIHTTTKHATTARPEWNLAGQFSR